MNRILILLGIIIASTVLNLAMDQNSIGILLEKLIFNSISILVGLSIAIVGIFLSSINTVYLSIYRLTKNKDQEEIFTTEEIQNIKSKLSELVDELKENSLFSLYTFLAVIVIFFLKEIDIPNVTWFIQSEFITKVFVINTLILIGNFLIFWAIIDSMKVVFQISKAFELIKEDV
ncbi:hypothetical protein [Salegentibacter flavus]|uniref:Uncharacterized protein n=1 Tax=Salegentibacter flavus TaxID=287099 RepID=A0A1I5CEK7_9FLAO|nr:hypothetical protein [Salegentibacter flavus]SFN85324.1 hypothetical protein SAMN05660413_02813 [Salegentibacter flavus]